MGPWLTDRDRSEKVKVGPVLGEALSNESKAREECHENDEVKTKVSFNKILTYYTLQG